MFNLQRNRSRQPIHQRLSGVALTAGLLAVLTSPAQAQFGSDSGGSEASGGNGRITGLAFNIGGAAPPSASNCIVEGYEGDGRYYVIAVEYGSERDEADRVVEGVIKDRDVVGDDESILDRELVTEEDDNYVAPNPQLVDPDNEDQPEADGSDLDSFHTDLENGKFDVDGSEWAVWHVYCGDKEEPEDEDFSIVAAPTSPAGLVLPALDFVEEYLPEPQLTLQPFDEDNDWTYVQAPIDFRTTTETLQPITITADTGGPEEIREWITITATPNTVIYNSGDTDTNPTQTECPAEAADDPYVIETPGVCSYSYRNSSSIKPNNVFEAELSITWTVDSIDKDGVQRTLTVEPTTEQVDVAVAEVKAVNVYDR